MFQNIFYKIQRMQEEYWSTGKYTLDYEWENLSYHIRHLDTDEILLERRREGSSRAQRLVMPLQEFRFCSSQRIFHLLHDFEEPASAPASGVPGSGQIYDSMRVILLGAFPEGCVEYEAYLRGIQEVELIKARSLWDAKRLLRTQGADFIICCLADKEAMSDYFEELLSVTGKPIDLLPCTLMFVKRIPMLDDWYRSGRTPLTHFQSVLRMISVSDSRMPSAAWIARYLLSSMDIREGCYTRELTADELFHMLGDLLQELLPEARSCLLRTATEALLPEKEFRKLWKKYLRHKREPAPLRAHTICLLRPVHKRQCTRIRCSQTAWELLSADSHRQMRIGSSPVQKGQPCFVWRENQCFYPGDPA